MYSVFFLLLFFTAAKAKTFHLCFLFLFFDSYLTPLAFMEARIP